MTVFNDRWPLRTGSAVYGSYCPQELRSLNFFCADYYTSGAGTFCIISFKIHVYLLQSLADYILLVIIENQNDLCDLIVFGFTVLSKHIIPSISIVVLCQVLIHVLRKFCTYVCACAPGVLHCAECVSSYLFHIQTKLSWFAMPCMHYNNWMVWSFVAEREFLSVLLLLKM